MTVLFSRIVFSLINWQSSDASFFSAQSLRLSTCGNFNFTVNQARLNERNFYAKTWKLWLFSLLLKDWYFINLLFMRFTVCKRKRGAREELGRLLLLLWAFHGFPPTESAFKHRLRKLSFLGKLSYSISSLKKKKILTSTSVTMFIKKLLLRNFKTIVSYYVLSWYCQCLLKWLHEDDNFNQYFLFFFHLCMRYNHASYCLSTTTMDNRKT